MFRVDAKKPVRFCDGLTRRDFLHAGSLTALGLGLPAMQALASPGAIAPDRDVNCILLFLVGGPSQLDTWDMKPEAPEEIRGPFRPIATKVPGIQVSEVFPRLAAMMDKVSLVRSVYHTAAAVHDTGHQMMQTGRLFTGGIEHPPYGSVLAKLKGSRHDTPPYVLLPKPIGPTGGNLPHGHAAGYLGKTYDPFILNADPNDKVFKVPDLLPPDYVTAVRESRRRSLRAAIDGAVGSFESSADARLLDANFEGAFKLMSSPQAREAFDRSRRAGRHPRPLRPHPVRPELPAGPPADRARGPVRHGEHVRDRLQRDHLGHPRLGPVQPDRVLQERGRPELRQRLHRTSGGPRRAGGCSKRRWCSRSASSAGRPRSTRPAAATITRPAGPCSSPAGRSRAGASSAPPTRSAMPPRTDRSPPPRSPRRSTTDSASTWPPSSPAPRAGRSALVDHGVEPIEELF